MHQSTYLKKFFYKSISTSFSSRTSFCSKILLHNVNISNNQVLFDLLAVFDNLIGNTTQELLGLAQIQNNSTSRLLKALDNFIENVAFIYDSKKNKPFTLNDLNTQFTYIAFDIKKDIFTSDVVSIAKSIGGNASVVITSTNQQEITPETVAVIKVPQPLFLNKTETVYSYQFRKPSLFLTDAQLQRLNGSKVKNDQIVDSDILSAAILRRKIKNISNPIILSFKPSQTTDLEGTLECQFWDPYLSKSGFASLFANLNNIRDNLKRI